MENNFIKLAAPNIGEHQTPNKTMNAKQFNTWKKKNIGKEPVIFNDI